MATPAEPDGTDDLEDTATEEIAAAIAAAIAASGPTGAALLAAADRITTTVTTAVRTAITRGARVFARLAGIRTPEPPPADDIARITRSLNVGQGITYILTDAARGLARAEETAEHLARTRRRLQRDAATKITAGYSEGAAHQAQTARTNLVWTTRGDRNVCPVCRSLNGTVVGASELFDDGPTQWEWFTGRPPAHPNCRCRLRPAS